MGIQLECVCGRAVMAPGGELFAKRPRNTLLYRPTTSPAAAAAGETSGARGDGPPAGGREESRNRAGDGSPQAGAAHQQAPPGQGQQSAQRGRSHVAAQPPGNRDGGPPPAKRPAVHLHSQAAEHENKNDDDEDDDDDPALFAALEDIERQSQAVPRYARAHHGGGTEAKGVKAAEARNKEGDPSAHHSADEMRQVSRKSVQEAHRASQCPR